MDILLGVVIVSIDVADLKHLSLKISRTVSDVESPSILFYELPHLSLEMLITLFAELSADNQCQCYLWSDGRGFSMLGFGVARSIEYEDFTAPDIVREDIQNLLSCFDIGDSSSPILGMYSSFDRAYDPQAFWAREAWLTVFLPAVCLYTRDDHSYLQVAISRKEESVQISKVLDLLTAVYPEKSSSDAAENVQVLGYRTDLDISTWSAAINTIKRHIRSGEVEKVVLSRKAFLDLDRQLNLGDFLRNLHSDYPNLYLYALSKDGFYFVGSSPEMLAEVYDGKLATMALAGSVPLEVSKDSIAQKGLALKRLLGSSKDMHEHNLVVQSIVEALKEVATHIGVDDLTVTNLPNILHLQTPIKAYLQPGRDLLDALTYIHPTAAVAGYPRYPSIDLISALEPQPRGLYSGTMGWIDAEGNGSLSVSLRCAAVRDKLVVVFAGCGIVSDSDPQAEYLESEAKMRPIFSSLPFGVYGIK